MTTADGFNAELKNKPPKALGGPADGGRLPRVDNPFIGRRGGKVSPRAGREIRDIPGHFPGIFRIFTGRPLILQFRLSRPPRPAGEIW